jgi:hypothetical protein
MNNRGCVNVTMGNYPEANRLFELAMSKHMAISESNPSSCSSDCTNSVNGSMRCVNHNNNNFDDISIDSDIDIEDDDKILDTVDDMEYDDLDDFKNHESLISIDETSTSRNSATGASAAIGSASLDFFSLRAFAADHHCIQRTTTSSTIPISPFCGQQHHPSRNMNNGNTTNRRRNSGDNEFHEVYCLPIVMDDAEWDCASLDDKTFVLIFNTAICNHLWGMSFQQHEHRQANEEREMDQQSQTAFLVAEKLYCLALNSAIRVGRTISQSPHRSASIDYQFCLVAVLNNRSHVSKTLEGASSQEASHIDQMLLKAIFWWRDAQEQRRSSLASNNLDSNHSYGYDNADAEVIDLFLENVFYLIGISHSLVPAAAA